MRGGDLLDKMELADPKYVAAAENARRTDRPDLSKWIALAASLAIVAAGVFALIRFGLPKSATPRTGEMSGGTGEVYMSYAGPVFPLTMGSADDEISAERDITFDLSPFETRKIFYEQSKYYTGYDSKAIVTDSYRLTNTSDSDKSVTLIYPFAGSLIDDLSVIPTVTVDGVSADASLKIGEFAGKFVGTADPYNVGTYNIGEPTSWTDYRAIIENGYMDTAFDGYPDLTQPVTVYEVTGEGEVIFEYRRSFDNLILSDGFSGYNEDRKAGTCQKYLSNRAECGFLIVLGDDIWDVSIDGEGEFERYETELGVMLDRIAERYYSSMEDYYSGREYETQALSAVSPKEYAGLAGEMLWRYGLMSDNVMDRYSDGRLDDFMREVASVHRIMYVTFDAVIPAHGTVTVSANMTKAASIDFIGEGANRNGFDLVTTLGSNIRFTEQTASVTGTEYVRFLNNSFGFDPESGVTRVNLDLNEQHYYMDVEKIDGR